ncbi:phosphotransferase enzyme family protein [Hirsutella rhossiliensis]|uniref:Phosphotransferase enzyme family domain-containing protein n=1 Tax=Hirsutella rhossiliensis TaxID=111463 RepID=A0A9P8SKQ2_9HYPO|nr:phosphotransferase enzyme family domain-containing protein [Hirsutella rhossiliensis]KAH0965015.1 phosphotransferase enzyme family domain-containing protein [Hirsutella rhossiliensis]
MATLLDPQRVAQLMLSWLNLDLVSCTELQTLWAGYGHICAIEARPTTPPDTIQAGTSASSPLRLVLKLICPPSVRPGDEGHLRKMLSYEVEQYLYDELAPHLRNDVAVARCLASTRSSRDRAVADGIQDLTATLLTDLRPQFPVAGHKRCFLTPRQVKAALEWLSRFHSSSWGWLPRDLDQFVLPPLEEARRRQLGRRAQGKGLWLNGGYTYLATRRKEYAALAADDESEWSVAFCRPAPGLLSSVAELAADFLTPSGRPFETCIHGDVKSENLFSTDSGDRVAFFDFQYAGVGLGVCDLAKLLTCSVPLDMLTDVHVIPAELPMGQGEKVLLDQYRALLLDPQPGKTTPDYGWDEFSRHWETALVDWCRFQASWGFWGNTDWLQARVRCILRDQGWRDWLERQAKGTADGAA